MLGPWLARMSYSISPPVMSKPMNCTFSVVLSSTARGLRSTCVSVKTQSQVSSNTDETRTLCPQEQMTAPVGDGVLQAVVYCWAILGGAVFAAEETAMVLLVLAPALEALALVLFCHSNGVDELDVGISAPMTNNAMLNTSDSISCNAGPTSACGPPRCDVPRKQLCLRLRRHCRATSTGGSGMAMSLLLHSQECQEAQT